MSKKDKRKTESFFGIIHGYEVKKWNCSLIWLQKEFLCDKSILKLEMDLEIFV